MANVVSVNISEKKGQMKHEVPSIELKIKHGIVGDAHAGDWHRQVSMLAEESVLTKNPIWFSLRNTLITVLDLSLAAALESAPSA